MKRIPGIAALLFAALHISSMLTRAQIITEFQPDVMWGGRAVAIAVHPTDPASAIVASESGGLFKTTNTGALWSHINSLPPFRMSDVKYAPPSQTGEVIVIATAWSDSRTINGGGIWRSLDGGETWSKPATANPPAGPRCTARASAWGIAFEPGSTNVYVGTDCGIAISRNLGETWEHSIPDPDVTPNNRIFSVVAQRGGIVDVCGDNGPYRSITGGRMWRTVDPGIGPCAVHSLAVSPLETNVLFAAVLGAILPPGVCGPRAAYSYRVLESDDGGGTWTQIIDDQCTGRPPWVKAGRARVANPDNFELYFSNGVNAVRQTCTNRGGAGLRCSRTAWTPLITDHTDHNDLAFGSGNCPLYLASDAGVHMTSDCGATWRVAGGGRAGFNALQLYEVAGQIHDDGHTDLYLGTQDNDLWASPDDGLNWPPGLRLRYEGFALQMERETAAHDEQTITGVACFACVNFRTAAHFTGLAGWNNPPGGGGNPFIMARGTYLQWSQSAPPATTLYVTSDTGARWTPRGTVGQTLSGWPQIAGPPDRPIVYQAIRKPGMTSGGDAIFGLVRITGVRGTGTITITPADDGLNSLGVYNMGQGTFGWPHVFGVDPASPYHLIAADFGSGQMKVSTNGGESWTVDEGMRQLTALVTAGRTFRFNIPPSEDRILYSPGVNLQAHVIGFDPFVRNHILVGTEAAGIIRSFDGGRSWRTIPGSEQVTGITSFFFGGVNPDDSVNTVLVATYGRGLWKLRLPYLRRPFLLAEFVANLWSDNWIRDRYTGDLIPLEQFLDPEYCPICLYYVVRDGTVMNILVNENKEVKGLVTDGGRVLVSQADGRQAPLDLPVEMAKESGDFEGCPGCVNIIKKGGMIKGFVLAKGQLRALIAGAGELPGEKTLGEKVAPPEPVPTKEPSQTKELAPVSEPYIQIVGTIPVTGLKAAFTGEAITLYGRNFCGEPRCPPVEVRIGDRVVAKDVKVESLGFFKITIPILEPPGQYFVTAIQTVGQSKLMDRELLVVPVREREEK